MFSLKGIKYQENSMKLNDMVSPYKISVIVVLVINLIYYCIKYKKIGILEVVEYTLISAITIQLLLISIFIIIRIPVNSYIMSISMLLYILTFVTLTEIFEKKSKNESSKQK